MLFANVIIDNPSSQVDYQFDYVIPDNMNVLIGTRVKVPFGMGNRPTLGIVLDISDKTAYLGEIKPILEVLDETPILTQVQIELAKNIKLETISPMSRILNLMIPEGLRLQTIKYYEVINGSNLDANLLHLFNGERLVKVTPKFKDFDRQIKTAINCGDIVIRYDAVQKKQPKWIKKYSVYYDEFELHLMSQKSEIRKEVLYLLKEYTKGLTYEDLESIIGVSKYLITKMVKEGYLKELYEPYSRTKQQMVEYHVKDIKTSTVVDNYMIKYNESNKLLYMPSSKDEELEFIIKIINDNLNKLHNTLILCSDILQSYEIASKIRKLLKIKVACLNSNLTDSAIYDYFYELDKYQVFVSTPAFSLWNYPNIQTIIMLDQESSNYRNDQSPRYDLNLVMIDFIKLQKQINNLDIKLVLDSTAPLLNTYKEAMLGHITLLSNKVDDNINYEVVNLTTLAKEHKSTIISPTLYMKISEALKKGEKTILILNNKGYSTSVTCRSCGTTLKCYSCKVPFQYHKDKHELYCPVCYRKTPEPKVCPVCKTNKLSYDGIGMEKLEETVISLFDTAKVKVLNESKLEELEEVIDNFNQNELDILITSDTFSRSIDVKDLTVVGIINLDVVLNTPSYIANHLAYSMLQHAKKLLNRGSMIIQTSDTKNIVLKNFILNDYDEYFYEEIKVRESLQVEPLYEVNRILVKGDFKEVFITANNIKKTIQNINSNILVIGPSYNYKEKKVQLIVKHKDPNIKKIYMHIYEMFQKKDTMVIFDRYSKSIS